MAPEKEDAGGFHKTTHGELKSGCLPYSLNIALTFFETLSNVVAPKEPEVCKKNTYPKKVDF